MTGAGPLGRPLGLQIANAIRGSLIAEEPKRTERAFIKMGISSQYGRLSHRGDNGVLKAAPPRRQSSVKGVAKTEWSCGLICSSMKLIVGKEFIDFIKFMQSQQASSLHTLPPACCADAPLQSLPSLSLLLLHSRPLGLLIACFPPPSWTARDLAWYRCQDDRSKQWSICLSSRLAETAELSVFEWTS